MDTNLSPELIKATFSFIEKWDSMRRIRLNYKPAKLHLKVNRKFIKVFEILPGNKYKKVMAFINPEGDILEPGNWNTPTKNVVGNVFSKRNGMESVTPNCVKREFKL